MHLGVHEHDEEDHQCNTHGPYKSEEHALQDLDNYSNPGGWSTDDSGKKPAPTNGLNGRPLVGPRPKGQNWY